MRNVRRLWAAFWNIGPGNPVAVRIVGTGSARPKHLLIRSGYVAALVLLVLWSLLALARAGSLTHRELALAGAKSLELAVFAQLTLVCLLTPLFMAGAIDQETRPRTLNVLLTTPLRPAHLVLGNIIGRLCFIGALLIASLPLFATTQYFGGVAAETVLACAGITACTAVLMATAAMAVAVTPWAGSRAVFTFYVGTLTYLAATAIAHTLLPPVAGNVTHATALNPFLAMQTVLGTPGGTTANRAATPHLWIAQPAIAWCAGSLLSGAALTAAAVWMLPRTLSTKGASGQTVSARAGSAIRAVWRNPVAWREAAARKATPLRLAGRWAFLGIGFAGAAVCPLMHRAGALSGHEFRDILASVVLAETLVVTLVVVQAAAAAIVKEREDGTLDLLIITPLTPKQYLHGKALGLVRAMGPIALVPIVTLMVAGLYVATSGFGGTQPVVITEFIYMHRIQTPLVMPAAIAVAPLAFGPFFFLCAVASLARSLISKGTIGATVTAAGSVTLVLIVTSACVSTVSSGIFGFGAAAIGFTPINAIFAMVAPAQALEKTLLHSGTGAVNLYSTIGASAAATLYVGIGVFVLATLCNTFDKSVRELAGRR